MGKRIRADDGHVEEMGDSDVGAYVVADPLLRLGHGVEEFADPLVWFSATQQAHTSPPISWMSGAG
jgi:hypothetical protein